MSVNKAAWIPAKCAPFKVDEAPMPQPEANEVIIRVRAVAINPVDAAIQGMGIIIEDYPAVVGCDVAGDVTGVGAEVKAFLPGDRVIACLDLEVGRVNKGSFQLYCAALTTLAAKLPVNVSYTQGCVLPLALSTAATSLFQKGNLEMQHPLIDAKPNGKGVLIWGGSSSVGSCAIQMAKAAGYEVATTCSRHNIEYCRSLGADHVFDHRKGNVVEDVVHALNGKEFAGAFDAVFPPDTIMKCAKIAHKLGGKKHVATVMVPSMPIPKGLPEGVMTSYCWGSSIKNDEVGTATWGSWVTPALAQGSLKCKPEPVVVGQGLGAIQEACDRMKKGVSAAKLVVEMDI